MPFDKTFAALGQGSVSMCLAQYAMIMIALALADRAISKDLWKQTIPYMNGMLSSILWQVEVSYFVQFRLNRLTLPIFLFIFLSWIV